MYKFLSLLLFFTSFTKAFSQNAEVKQIAKSVTRGIDNDSMKVVSICQWIIDNIVYDYENAALAEPKKESYEINSIVKRKKRFALGMPICSKFYAHLTIFKQKKLLDILLDLNLKRYKLIEVTMLGMPLK